MDTLLLEGSKVNNLGQFFEELEFGNVQHFENLSLLPVYSSFEQRLDYITMQEAIVENQLEITEVNEIGVVSKLKAKNKSLKPIFLLDGEEIKGAKQNRVFNTTILLKEQSETYIPVSCSERGRWSYKSSNFSPSNNIMPFNIREKKFSSVSRNLNATGQYHSDQNEVWHEIRQFSNSAGVHSSTDAMSDIFQTRESYFDEYEKKFHYMPDQKGMVVFIRGAVAGFEYISSSKTMEILFPGLLKSYVVEAINQSKLNISQPSFESVYRFVAEIGDCTYKKHKSVGYGYDYRYSNTYLGGSALIHQKEVIHSAFFRVNENPINNFLVNFAKRRGFRR